VYKTLPASFWIYCWIVLLFWWHTV